MVGDEIQQEDFRFVEGIDKSYLEPSDTQITDTNELSNTKSPMPMSTKKSKKQAKNMTKPRAFAKHVSA